MKELLKNWVDEIRKHPFSMNEFARFKLHIIDFGLPDLVDWSAPALGKAYVKFNLNWEKLNDPVSAFIAWVMIDNVGVSIPRDQKSVWDLLPKCPEE